MSGILKRLLQPFLAVALGLALGLGIAALGGDSAWVILKALLNSAFGSRYDFGMTLFYSAPLVLTGLSVAMGLEAGLFNIGAEGQMGLGALAAAAVGIGFPGVPWPLAPALAVFAAFLAGATWGAIPGWLRAKRGSHEVIITIMMNFIAAGVASYFTLYVFKAPHSQNSETSSVAAAYLIHPFAFFMDAPVSAALLLSLVIAGGTALFFRRTVAGYELRAVGANEMAARFAGIDVGRSQLLALTFAGGIAGLAGIPEVLSASGRFRMGFSPGYGFMGIAVALLGRRRAMGIIAAALLFGALQKGTAYLELDTQHVTRDLSQILQALVILSVSADGLWRWLKNDRL
ncbi:MAG: ABC transporter permease [Oligoflexia bacterium]|nr:ABC transporter permease [Oligoflexia bacterium]